MAESWLEKNTFHHGMYDDIEELVRKKEAQGITISVCFPALNEEPTIGAEIETIRDELMKKHALVDEIAVIDGGSSDKTVEISLAAGAKVFRASDCLPHLEDMPGKGDNLWKSLYLLEGDIIVWLDADIRDLHPKFVYGLVGPLLDDPGLKFTKAFYERPLLRPDEQDDFGGGRVTEILVRPLFSAFFPELALFYQPCSGECAGRRDMLESLSFAAGYGIETGMLIDISSRFGPDVIAQVNLDKRIHRNQSTTALGKMGFEIIHAFFSRLEGLDRAKFQENPALNYCKLNCSPSVYELEHTSVQLNERPPMSTIPEYKEERGLGS